MRVAVLRLGVFERSPKFTIKKQNENFRFEFSSIPLSPQPPSRPIPSVAWCLGVVGLVSESSLKFTGQFDLRHLTLGDLLVATVAM